MVIHSVYIYVYMPSGQPQRGNSPIRKGSHPYTQSHEQSISLQAGCFLLHLIDVFDKRCDQTLCCRYDQEQNTVYILKSHCG